MGVGFGESSYLFEKRREFSRPRKEGVGDRVLIELEAAFYAFSSSVVVVSRAREEVANLVCLQLGEPHFCAEPINRNYLVVVVI